MGCQVRIVNTVDLDPQALMCLGSKAGVLSLEHVMSFSNRGKEFTESSVELCTKAILKPGKLSLETFASQP